MALTVDNPLTQVESSLELVALSVLTLVSVAHAIEEITEVESQRN